MSNQFSSLGALSQLQKSFAHEAALIFSESILRERQVRLRRDLHEIERQQKRLRERAVLEASVGVQDSGSDGLEFALLSLAPKTRQTYLSHLRALDKWLGGE